MARPPPFASDGGYDASGVGLSLVSLSPGPGWHENCSDAAPPKTNVGKAFLKTYHASLRANAKANQVFSEAGLIQPKVGVGCRDTGLEVGRTCSLKGEGRVWGCSLSEHFA